VAGQRDHQADLDRRRTAKPWRQATKYSVQNGISAYMRQASYRLESVDLARKSIRPIPQSRRRAVSLRSREGDVWNHLRTARARLDCSRNPTRVAI
jgi:hypothetical protein